MQHCLATDSNVRKMVIDSSAPKRTVVEDFAMVSGVPGSSPTGFLKLGKESSKY